MLPPKQNLDHQVQARGAELAATFLRDFWKQTDRAFAVLLVVQWVAGIGLALWLTPTTWSGSDISIHFHVLAASLFGGLVALPAAALGWWRGGRTSTRFCIAVAQMLWSALLIHLTGGRVESHFHVFGSLAFLAFYRDWRVLIVASGVVVGDHLIRDLYWPLSLYGSLDVSPWRWVEHAGWVVFEDIFLIYTCHRSRQLIAEHGVKHAEAEILAARFEQAVVERTAALAATNARLEEQMAEGRRVARELEESREKADCASRAKSQFMANMSHEIRTPMNGVIGMTSLLSETPLNAQQRNFTDIIRQSCDALMVIINDVLDFSRMESGKLDLDEQPFDLRNCVEDALALFSERLTEKPVQVGYEIAPGTPEHWIGDAGRLRQVLLNLVNNGFKFTDKGTVLVSISSTPAEETRGRKHDLRIDISDTGIGIAPDRIGQLFQGFSQVDSSMTRKYGGTGLGLAIARNLCQVMGGDISVTSAPGVGSTFTCTMRMQISANRDTGLGDGERLAGRTLLVLSESQLYRKLIGQQARGWRVDVLEATSWDGALQLLKDGRRIDAAILDMETPGIGLDRAMELHAMPGSQYLPLIQFSAVPQGNAQEDPRWLHFASRFGKPVRTKDLFHALGTAMGPALPAAAGKAEKTAKLSEALPLRVLLAEDNPVNQKVASRMLESLGYRCEVAANGREAVEQVDRQTYDVILMDVQMPEMDGYAATETIQSKYPPKKRPQIIALTAHASPEDRQSCLSCGMDDYMTKPVVRSVLEQKLREAAARRAALALS